MFEPEALSDPFEWYRKNGPAPIRRLPNSTHGDKIAALMNATGTTPWPGYHTVETDIGTKDIKGDSLKKAWEREAREFTARFPSVYRAFRVYYGYGYLAPRQDGIDPLWLMLISEMIIGAIPESEAKAFAGECDTFFKTKAHSDNVAAWIGEAEKLKNR
ncbi:MAG TPA: hypothetical protein PJ986_14815 [Gammaproteobacteria bacterium]|nr:hypothetical protein [Gammaproteobacteria bacterium]